jgi:hypothetical protein
MTDNTAQNKQNTTVTDTNKSTTQVPQQVTVTTGGKEQSPLVLEQKSNLKTTQTEVEIAKETEELPIEETSGETAQISQDLQNIGVSPTGLATPVPIVDQSQIPQVKLPIEDETVVLGLHADVTSTLKWLAIWCVRKLAKAHLAIKVIHGKIKRVKTK